MIGIPEDQGRPLGSGGMDECLMQRDEADGDGAASEEEGEHGPDKGQMALQRRGKSGVGPPAEIGEGLAKAIEMAMPGTVAAAAVHGKSMRVI